MHKTELESLCKMYIDIIPLLWYNVITVKERTERKKLRKVKIMANIELVKTYEYEEDSYTNILFDIIVNGEKVGDCSILNDDSYAYCERIDINENSRNNGFGTAALNELSDMFGGVVVAPDNADAQRLYERIGNEYTGDCYFDQGFGVYRI